MQSFLNFGVNSDTLVDVVQLSYLLNQDIRSQFLTLVKNILDIDLPKEEMGEMDMGQYPLRAWCLYKVGEELLAEASNKDVLKIYKEIDGPLFSVLSNMEQRGIALNSKYLKKLELKFSETLAEIEKKIKEASGDEEVNLRSSKQVGSTSF